MRTLFTLQWADGRGCGASRWAIGAAAMLIAFGAPAVACEKSPIRWIAEARTADEGAATLTGEFVNGAPVYRLPPVTVVARRPAEVARARKDDAHPHSNPVARSRAKPPIPTGNVASAPRAIDAIEPCVG